MSVPFNKFNCFTANIAAAKHDMNTGTLHVYKVYFTNTQPLATNTVYNTPPDLSTAGGYTAGGLTIGAITGAQIAGVFSFSGATSPSLTATGSVGPFQWAVLYNSTSPTLPLIGWWDYGSALTLLNTNVFNVGLPTPILTIT